VPLVPFARLAFAAALIFWGAQHLYFGDFVTRAMPRWPDDAPLRSAFAYLLGALFVLCGAAIAFRRQPRRAAYLVSLVVFLGFAFLALPAAFNDVPLGGAWTNAGKALVIATGSLAIAATFSIDAHSPTDRLFVLAARLSLGAFLLQSGLQHFRWADFVHTLVPPWIPAVPFWTYFTGIALIAAGLGLFLPRTARLAALASGAMIFAWVLMVHAPRALLTVRDANEATALFEAIAFSGLAFLLAAKTAAAPAPLTPPPIASPHPPAL
jgi:Predicted membrane protein